MDEPKITNVYHWGNGMMMVFDQFGKQMPEFQGLTSEMLPKLLAAGLTFANYQEIPESSITSVASSAPHPERA